MSTRFGRLFGRKGTSSKFGAADEEAKKLPAVKEESVTVASTSKKEKEKATDAVADKVDTEHQKEKEEETTDVQTPQVKPKAQDGVLMTRGGTSSNATPSGVYSMLWKGKTDYRMSPIEYTSTAQWVPNLMSFKPIIEECARLVGQSDHCRKHNQTFNPYAFATGIYYLSFIQILRAQKAAGKLIGQDSSALARFEKYNPLASIMIPEPFIPFFEAIVATQLKDAKYRWITPTHGLDFTNRNTLEHHMTPSNVDVIRPNLLFMLMNLNTFGAYSRTDMPTHLDDARIFTPVKLDRTAGNTTRFLNGNRHFDDAWPNSSRGTEVENVIQMCGANTVFQFWNDNYLAAHDYMARSNYFVENGVTLQGRTLTLTNVANARAIDGVNFDQAFPAGQTINSLDKYLFIAKENNPSWVKYLVANINYVARFFKASKPFSKIATTGGLECGVITTLKLETPQAANNNRYVYEDLRLGRANRSSAPFYGDRFGAMTASFRTTRADLEENEELNAICIGINANPPVSPHANDHTIRSGRFFTDIVQGMQFSEMLSLGFDEPEVQGTVPMYSDLKDDFVAALFDRKPAEV